MSESPLYVGRAVAALAADPNVLARNGQLCSSWELARNMGSPTPTAAGRTGARTRSTVGAPPGIRQHLFRTGTRLQLQWLNTLAARTYAFMTKVPVGGGGAADRSTPRP